MKYYVCEEGDEDFGFTWDLFQDEQEKIVKIGTFYSEAHALRCASALSWQDVLGEGRMSLAMDGISFGADGKPRKARKPREIRTKPKKKAGK